MSKLKVYVPQDGPYGLVPEEGGAPVEEETCYLKSEADKLIAELEKERDWLAKDRAQAYDDLEKRAQLNIKQEESVRRQKYKRCLVMAKWCHNQREIYERDSYDWELDDEAVASLRDKANIMRKWCKRWLKIAEQFKEVQ